MNTTDIPILTSWCNTSLCITISYTLTNGCGGGSRLLKRGVPRFLKGASQQQEKPGVLMQPIMQHTCIRTCQNIIIHIILVAKNMHCNLMNAMDAWSYICCCSCSIVILASSYTYQLTTYMCMFNYLYSVHLYRRFTLNFLSCNYGVVPLLNHPSHEHQTFHWPQSYSNFLSIIPTPTVLFTH